MLLQKSIAALVDWVKAGAPPRPNRLPPGGLQRRRCERIRTSFRAVLLVRQKPVPVQGVDLHEHGAGVISPVELDVGSVVLVKLNSGTPKDPRTMVGFGHVRHCTAAGRRGYAVGFEFPNELMPQEPGGWNYQRVSPTTTGG